MSIEKIEINISKLPLILQFKINGEIKQYVLRCNKEKTGIFLNKKEQY